MKAKIMTVVAALFAGALHADDQYLYWMVDAASEYAFSYATVSTVGGDVLMNALAGGEPYGTKIPNVNDPESGTQTEGVYAYDVTGWETSTFLFELFNDSDLRVAYKYVQGSALENYIGGSMGTIADPYRVTDVVPEPTSGMLLLLGVAGLALRRRRNGTVG